MPVVLLVVGGAATILVAFQLPDHAAATSVAGGVTTVVMALGSAATQRVGHQAEMRVELLTRDLTETNRRLERTGLRLEQAVSRAGVGLWERNLRTGEIWVSPQYAAMYGDDVETWEQPQTFAGRLHPEDRTAVMERRHQPATELVEETFRLKHADGNYRWTLSRWTTTEGSEGPVQIGDQLDISDHHRTLSEVERLNQQLVRSNASLRDFTHVASHDLRSPLRAISSLISFIHEDAASLDETTLGHLDRVQERIARMNRLIDDLLAYARSGGRDDTIEPTDVDDLLYEIAETVDLPAEMSVHIDSSAGIVALCPPAFAICVRNLVDNAIKHNSTRPGMVRVAARIEGDSVICSVTDDGPGIDEKNHSRIFEPFLRLNADTSDNHGSGIGLAVIRRTLEAHGATIVFESTLGTGSTFEITWPIVAHAAPDPTARPMAAAVN